MYIVKTQQQEERGPLSLDEVLVAIQMGELNRHSLAREASADFWQPLIRFPEFKAAFGQSASTAKPIDVEATVATESRERSDDEKTDPTDSSGPAGSRPGHEPRRYFMTGVDGREYGPADEAQMRRWIQQGRANAQTTARYESESGSRPLGTFPEFADLLGARSGADAPPKGSPSTGEDLADEILDRGYRVDIGACFSRAWELYKNNFWPLIGANTIALLIYFGLHSIATIGNVAALVLFGPIFGGLAWFYIKLIREGRADLNEMFSGFGSAFVALMLAGMVTTLLVGFGLVLCIIPGIYLMVAWMFTLPLVIERRMDFWPAMEVSRRVVHDNWFPLFGLFVLQVLLLFIGSLAFGIGLFFVAPIVAGMSVYAYEDIFGPAMTNKE